jgi:anti-sigma regulatory factor (Ser/Thr protein kinase)
MLDMTSKFAAVPREPGMLYTPSTPYLPPAPATVTEQEFPADVACLAEIRDLIAAAAGGMAAADDMILAASELAANAIVHGSGDGDTITVTVTVAGRDDVIRVDVTDPGQRDGMPCIRDVEDDFGSGRGMTIVDALASRWGFYRAAGGPKTTWAEFGNASAADTRV